jgi:hypothetical protein
MIYGVDFWSRVISSVGGVNTLQAVFTVLHALYIRPTSKTVRSLLLLLGDLAVVTSQVSYLLAPHAKG